MEANRLTERTVGSAPTAGRTGDEERSSRRAPPRARPGSRAFDRRLVSGLVAMALVALATSVVAVFATRRILPPEGADVRGRRFDEALRLQSLAGRKLYVAPVYLLSGDAAYRSEYESMRRELRQAVGQRLLDEPDPRGRAILREVLAAQQRHELALESAFASVGGQELEGTARRYVGEVAPLRARFSAALDSYVRFSTEAMSPSQSVLNDRIVRMRRWVLAVATVAVLLLGGMILALRGTLLGLYAAEAGQREAAAAARRATESLARSQAESHETTRLILGSALDAVVTTDASGAVTGWNDEAGRIFGWTEREIAGRPLHDSLLAPGARAAFQAALDAGGDGHVVRQIELDGVRRDGELFPVEVAVVPVHRGGIGFSVFLRDISERRRTLNRLRASEEEFRAAFESAGIGHAQVELPSGSIRRVNPKLCEMAGCDAEDLSGTSFATLLDDDGMEWLHDLARGEGDRAWHEARLRRRDGTRLAVHVTASVIRDPGGAPWRVQAVVQDLSELRRAQSALQATEERFQLLADSAPVLIWMSDPAARTTWVNRPWREFRGGTLEDEVRGGWEAGIHPDDRPDYAAAARAALAAAAPFTAEFRLSRADGEWRWMLSQGVPLRGAGGEFGGYVGTCVDITDRKRQEDQRERLLESERQARSDAERTSRIKDEFLATLSHELRTPLQAMLGWSRLLATQRLDAEQTRRGLEVIERNVTLQKRLIEDLLDMSRIVQGKMRLEVMPLDPAAVVDAAVEVVRPAAEAKLTRLTVVRDPEVGPVLGDAQRLQQAVWNLLSNAIKFTPSGGSVEVGLERAGDEVRIRVADSGEGIAREFLPYVFERFRQQDASITRMHRGLGLGLAIVRNLVELHGGRVSAESDGPGRGSTFSITLPVAHALPAGSVDRAATDGTAAAAAPPAPAPGETRLDGLHVLVVDDEPDARELLTRVLRDSGAEVRAARSVGEALDMLARERPDVLVSDIGMPGRDGYDLIRSVRAREGHGARVPALALTAFARPEDARRALAAGFHQHLSKPLEPHELTAAVLRLTGAHERQGAA